MYSTSFSVKDVIPTRASFCLTVLTYKDEGWPVRFGYGRPTFSLSSFVGALLFAVEKRLLRRADVCFGCDSQHPDMLAIHERVRAVVSFMH